MQHELLIPLILILFALSALFSGFEAAFLTLGRVRMRMMFQMHKGDSRVQSLARLKAAPERTLMTILIGNSVVNTTVSVLVAYGVGVALGDAYLGLATGLLTLVLLIACEIVPKSLATTNSEGVALFFSPPMEVLRTVLSPILWLLERITIWLPGQYQHAGEKAAVSEDELRTIIDMGVEDRTISADERKFFERVLDFNDTYVKEVMTPARSVKVFSVNDTPEQARTKAAAAKKERYPVVDAQGRVVGVLSLKQLVGASPIARIADLMDKPPFASKETVIFDLFRTMQKNRSSMTVVLEPDGRMAGIVTMEDLVEEIMGEQGAEPSGPSDGSTAHAALLVTGETRLHDLEKELGAPLPGADRFGSVAAYLHFQLKRLPARGDVLLIGKWRMEVQEVSSDLHQLKIKICLIGASA